MTGLINAHCQQFDCAHVQCANCPAEPQQLPHPLDDRLHPSSDGPVSEPHHSLPSRVGASAWSDEAQNPQAHTQHSPTGATLTEIKEGTLRIQNDWAFIPFEDEAFPSVPGLEHEPGIYEPPDQEVRYSAPFSTSFQPAEPLPNDLLLQHQSDGDDDVNDDTGKTAASRPQKRFACPLFKHNPAHWKACFDFRLSKISYVKQHITRKHKSDVMLSKEQKKALGKKSDPSETHAQQWYTIWKILFPNEQKPNSPYIESHRSEELSSLCQFWKTDAPDAMRETLQRLGFATCEEDAIADLTWGFFERMLKRWDAASANSAALLENGDELAAYAMESPSIAFVGLYGCGDSFYVESNETESTPIEEREEMPNMDIECYTEGDIGNEWLFDQFESTAYVDPAALAISEPWLN